MQTTSGRPAAAVGHLFLQASDVERAARRLEVVGVRVLMVRPRMAILELRGGTHIVLRRHSEAYPVEATFDLMFDDIDAAHREFQDAGFEVSSITNGGIHSSFRAVAPERFTLDVSSSHAGNRAV